MKKDKNLKCRQKLWESFNVFTMSVTKSSNEGKENGYRLMAVTNMIVLTYFLYLSFTFTLQDHLVPMLLERST